MKYLIDTCVFSTWAKRRSASVLEAFMRLSPADLATSVLVEHELRFSLALSPESKAAPLALELMGQMRVLPFDSACSERAALVRAELQRAGQPIGPYDLLIAATALVHGLIVVTHNTREFARVPNLSVEDWAQH